MYSSHDLRNAGDGDDESGSHENSPPSRTGHTHPGLNQIRSRLVFNWPCVSDFAIVFMPLDFHA